MTNELHEALKPFKKDYPRFLEFMNVEVERCRIDYSIMLFMIACLLLDEPANCYSIFGGAFFSSNKHGGCAEMIGYIIRDAQQFFAHK